MESSGVPGSAAGFSGDGANDSAACVFRTDRGDGCSARSCWLSGPHWSAARSPQRGSCVYTYDTSPNSVALAEAADACLGGSSFTPTTKVLLASGAAVPIATLKVGDKVLATNTKTGKTQPEAVAAVLQHYDTNLYNLTVETAHGNTSVIHTTANHLFWASDLKQWIPAAKLKKGERLKTADGSVAVAWGGAAPVQHDGWMWDLTVPGNNDHDFYVVTFVAVSGSRSEFARVPVLVHNSSLGCEDGPDGWPKPTMDNCKACAESIQDKIGGDVYQIRDSLGAPRLGPSVNDPGGDWYEHYAVIKDGVASDGFTGPGGIPVNQYLSQWQYGEDLEFVPPEG
jgi:hypothetical protein